MKFKEKIQNSKNLKLVLNYGIIKDTNLLLAEDILEVLFNGERIGNPDYTTSERAAERENTAGEI